jgi:hypothetical protein
MARQLVQDGRVVELLIKIAPHRYFQIQALAEMTF